MTKDVEASNCSGAHRIQTRERRTDLTGIVSRTFHLFFSPANLASFAAIVSSNACGACFRRMIWRATRLNWLDFKQKYLGRSDVLLSNALTLPATCFADLLHWTDFDLRSLHSLPLLCCHEHCRGSQSRYC